MKSVAFSVKTVVSPLQKDIAEILKQVELGREEELTTGFMPACAGRTRKTREAPFSPIEHLNRICVEGTKGITNVQAPTDCMRQCNPFISSAQQIFGIENFTLVPSTKGCGLCVVTVVWADPKLIPEIINPKEGKNVVVFIWFPPFFGENGSGPRNDDLLK